MKTANQREKGIGLVAAVVLLGVVALATAFAVPLVSQFGTVQKTMETEQQLRQLRIAIKGRQTLLSGGVRADYGFMGSMGSTPDNLSDLWLKESQPDFAVDEATLVGGGWTGAYVPEAFLENLLTLDKDAFGNDLVFTNTPFNRPEDSALVALRVLSPGPDGIANNEDDIFVDILANEVLSQVSGTLVVGGQPVPFATVTLNVPENGVIVKKFAVTDANGNYSFPDVSQGPRTLSIDPKLTLQEDAINVGNNSIEFKITNFGSDPVTIDSIRVAYDNGAFYDRVRVAGTTVYDDPANPIGSGQTVSFSPVTIAGTGRASQLIPIAVQTALTIAPPLELQGTGTTAIIIIDRFKDAQTNDVSMEGVNVTVTLSDGTVLQLAGDAGDKSDKSEKSEKSDK